MVLVLATQAAPVVRAGSRASRCSCYVLASIGPGAPSVRIAANWARIAANWAGLPAPGSRPTGPGR